MNIQTDHNPTSQGWLSTSHHVRPRKTPILVISATLAVNQTSRLIKQKTDVFRSTRQISGRVSSYYIPFSISLTCASTEWAHSCTGRRFRLLHVDNVRVHLTTRPGAGLRTALVPDRLDTRHRRAPTRVQFRLCLYITFPCALLPQLLHATQLFQRRLAISQW